MRFSLVAPLLLTLAACGTPQQQCIGQVTRDVTVLDQLIVETQGNLARGYGFAETVESVAAFVDCTPDATAEVPDPTPRRCFDTVPRTVTRPVALDLEAEAAKLASMQKRRAAMEKAVAPAIADCQARYPE